MSTNFVSKKCPKCKGDKRVVIGGITCGCPMCLGNGVVVMEE